MRPVTRAPAGPREALALAALLVLLAPPARAQGGAAGAAPAPVDSTAPPAPPPAPAPAFNPPAVVGQKKVRLIGKPDNVVRAGPGDGYAIVGVYPRDAEFPVIAKSGEWYDIRLSDHETGWIHASLCQELDDLSGLEFRPNPKLYTRTGCYVLSGYAGAYAFDRKSNSLVLGGRLGYYVFDRVLAEAGVSWTHVQRSQEIVESLFALSLEAEDFQMLFYQLNVAYELLPGRQMVPFLGAGVGSSILLGRSEPSFNFGAGTKLFVSKRTAVRWEFRDYRFHTGTGSSRLTNNNVEFTIGSEVLF
ncbi:MAG TPA: outer membrane beta-barrel domain-containing protein [Candidatus Eisenbacteria bacterium]